MPDLIEPAERVRESFLAGMAEFQAEARGAPSDDTMVGREIREFSGSWHTKEGFAAYVAWLCADAEEGTERPPGYVPSSTLWWVEGDEYLGRLAIRHRLTPRLLEMGGHIGYDVRPTARRRGHATAMLRAALPVAAGLGIDQVLVTCDTDNVGSRKVIESCGGRLEDVRGDKLRYWIDA